MVISVPYSRNANLEAILLCNRDAETVSPERITRFYLANDRSMAEDSVAKLKQVVDDLGRFMNIEQTTMLLNNQTT
jgi:hypothetical protein